MIEQRTSRHAEVEIRMVFNKVADMCITCWPILFQDMHKEALDDGTLEFTFEYSKV